MALGLNTNTSGGDFLPIVTFDARAGRMFRVDRAQQTDGSWLSNKVDITNAQPTFLMDFPTLETGWAAFPPTGPSFAMVPLGQSLPSKPSNDHKQAFKMRVFSPKHFDGLREFSSSSKAVIGAIDRLHSEYESAPEAAAGKLPIVKLSGSTAITSAGPKGSTTNYAPVFEISGWADRPGDWSAPTVPMPKAGARTSAPPPVATPMPAPAPTNHVPPPSPKPAPSSNVVHADDEMPF